MKTAWTWTLFAVALMVGAGHVAKGDDGHHHAQPDQQQARRDQLHAAVQGICPVSGNRLGEHGRPIKVSIGEQQEHVFFCCQGCLQRKIDPQHWATIHANFAKAQRICPVMGKPLPKNPKWTIVDGHIVYICCPPCSKKIAAEPETFLRKIDEAYTASLQAPSNRR